MLDFSQSTVLINLNPAEKLMQFLLYCHCYNNKQIKPDILFDKTFARNFLKIPSIESFSII